MHHDPRRQAQDKSDMAMLFQRQLTTKEREVCTRLHLCS